MSKQITGTSKPMIPFWDSPEQIQLWIRIVGVATIGCAIVTFVLTIRLQKLSDREKFAIKEAVAVRTIPDSVRAHVMPLLKAHPATLVLCAVTEQEPQDLREEVEQLFIDAGWSFANRGNEYAAGIPRGITWSVRDTSTAEMIAPIVDLFNSYGLKSISNIEPELDSFKNAFVILDISVGAKPIRP